MLEGAVSLAHALALALPCGSDLPGGGGRGAKSRGPPHVATAARSPQTNDKKDAEEEERKTRQKGGRKEVKSDERAHNHGRDQSHSCVMNNEMI